MRRAFRSTHGEHALTVTFAAFAVCSLHVAGLADHAHGAGPIAQAVAVGTALALSKRNDKAKDSVRAMKQTGIEA